MGAFAARFDGDFYRRRPEFLVYILAALVLKPVVFGLFGLYRRYWRYASLQDLKVVFLAVTVTTVVMAIFVLLVRGTLIAEFAWTVLLTDWAMTLVAAGGLRLAIRAAYEPGAGAQRPDPSESRRILIVGAGAAGTMVAREMRRNPQLRMEAVGFLDEDGEDRPAYRGTARARSTRRCHK